MLISFLKICNFKFKLLFGTLLCIRFSKKFGQSIHPIIIN